MGAAPRPQRLKGMDNCTASVDSRKRCRAAPAAHPAFAVAHTTAPPTLFVIFPSNTSKNGRTRPHPVEQ